MKIVSRRAIKWSKWIRTAAYSFLDTIYPVLCIRFPQYLPYSLCLTLNSPLDLKISQNGCLCCGLHEEPATLLLILLLFLFPLPPPLLDFCLCFVVVLLPRACRSVMFVGKRAWNVFLSLFRVGFELFFVVLFISCFVRSSCLWRYMLYKHKYTYISYTGSVYRSVRLMVLVSLGKLVEFLYSPRF